MTFGVSFGTLLLYGSAIELLTSESRDLYHWDLENDNSGAHAGEGLKDKQRKNGLSWLKNLLKWLLKGDNSWIEGVLLAQWLFLVIAAGLASRKRDPETTSSDHRRYKACDQGICR